MERQPKRVFSHDDLSIYERISPDDFPSYDHHDSTLICRYCGRHIPCRREDRPDHAD